MNNEVWCVDVCRTGKIFEVQTRNNDVEKVRAIRRKRLDGTKALFKMKKRQCKEE